MNNPRWDMGGKQQSQEKRSDGVLGHATKIPAFRAHSFASDMIKWA
jgi:hypothetical protein